METAKKFRVMTSITGANFHFAPKQIVTRGTVNSGDEMEAAMLDAFLATGDVVVQIDPEREAKRAQRAVAPRGVDNAQTADSRP